MVTFLSGGTGTPKLLAGADPVFPPAETTVVGNTGDDVELAGHLVCPDLDTVLFLDGEVLDRDLWWGIADDTATTHDELHRLADEAGLESGPRYLSAEAQTAGRPLSQWRRFSGVAEFMHVGDRDRAVHVTRTSLLDQGHSLTAVTDELAGGFGLELELLPMTDDPVASLIHTPDGFMHFQEFWVGRDGEPTVENVEFRGSSNAEPAPGVLDALDDVVVIGPSNPVTSIGPMLSVPGIGAALQETTVVAVSPFLGDEAFSGPVAQLMAAVGGDPSTQGLANAYPFADAFVVDEDDDASFDVHEERTDVRIDGREDAERVVQAVTRAIDAVE